MAAIAGDHEGHLAESRAAIAAGTANAQHRHHVGASNGGKAAKGVAKTGGGAKGVAKTSGAAKGVAKTGRAAKGVPRGPRKQHNVCSYRKPNNKLSALAICTDANCRSARSCMAAKVFIARRDSGLRAAKRARNEREMNAFD